MVFKGLEDRIDDVAMRAVAAFHMDVRRRVGGAALFGEPLERPLRIAVAKQRASVSPRGSVGQHIDGGIEPDGDGAIVQQVAGAGIGEGPAAGRDYPDLPVDQAGDQPPLAVAEILLAEALEDLGRRETGRILDGRVAVDEWQPEPPCQAPSDGRLAGAHQADEDDWTVEALDQMFHAWGYTAEGKLGQKPAPESPAERSTMSRIAVLILIILLVVGGLVFLSTQAREVPVTTIETDVSANAQ